MPASALKFNQVVCPGCGAIAEAECLDGERIMPPHCYACGWTEGDFEADDPHNIALVTDDDEPI